MNLEIIEIDNGYVAHATGTMQVKEEQREITNTFTIRHFCKNKSELNALINSITTTKLAPYGDSQTKGE